MKPDLVNIDLDLTSRSDPRAFVEAMAKKVLVLRSGKHRGAYSVTLELDETPGPSAEKMLRSFCRILEKLPAAAAKAWHAARTGVFNIGLASGDESPPCALDITPATLSRILRHNAGITITLYPQFHYDDSHVDSH